jgi:alpha-galactosidase
MRLLVLLFVSLVQDAGYNWMNLDDCYSEKKRNVDGDIVARTPLFSILHTLSDSTACLSDKTRFPSGMNNLTDQIHALGMKAGIASPPFDVQNES